MKQENSLSSMFKTCLLFMNLGMHFVYHVYKLYPDRRP